MLLARLRGWVHPMVFLSSFLPSLFPSLPPSLPSLLLFLPSFHSFFLPQVFIARPMCNSSHAGPVVTVMLIIFCSGGEQIHEGWWKRKAITGRLQGAGQGRRPGR